MEKKERMEDKRNKKDEITILSIHPEPILKIKKPCVSILYPDTQGIL